MQGDSGTLEFEVIGLHGHAALARDAGGAVARSGGADRRPAGRDAGRHGTSPRQSGAARQRAPVSHALERRSCRHLPDGSLRVDDVRQPAFLGGDGACRGGGGREGLARWRSIRRMSRACARNGAWLPPVSRSTPASSGFFAPTRTVRWALAFASSGTRPRRQLQWLHRHDHRHQREAAGRARDRVAEPRAGDDCEGISPRRDADHAAAVRRGTGAGHAVVDPAARCRRDPPATGGRSEPASGLREGSRRRANRRARGLLRYRGLSPPPRHRRGHRHRSAVDRLQGARSGFRASRLLVDTHLRHAGQRARDLRDVLPGATPAGRAPSAPHPAVHFARGARDWQASGGDSLAEGQSGVEAPEWREPGPRPEHRRERAHLAFLPRRRRQRAVPLRRRRGLGRIDAGQRPHRDAHRGRIVGRREPAL